MTSNLCWEIVLGRFVAHTYLISFSMIHKLTFLQISLSLFSAVYLLVASQVVDMFCVYFRTGRVVELYSGAN